MAGALRHLAGPVATPDDVVGCWAEFRPADQVAIAAFTPKAGVPAAAVERSAWRAPSRARKAAGIRLVESGIWRGPEWKAPGATVKAGSWVAGFRLDNDWQAAKSGQLTPIDALKCATQAGASRKGKQQVKTKKLKRLAKAAAARAAIPLPSSPSVSALEWTNTVRGHGVSLAGQQAGPPPFTAAQAVAKMQKAAKKAERDGEVAKAKQIRNEVCLLKMQIAERARARDPETLARSARGMGNPLFGTIRTHGLGDDPDVGGV